MFKRFKKVVGWILFVPLYVIWLAFVMLEKTFTGKIDYMSKDNRLYDFIGNLVDAEKNKTE